MSQFDAIYTRQSVDRVDSISTESQVEFCKKEVTDNNFKVYTDKGYSGKSIDRPAFKELMNDIKSGVVRRVIVYRLDRISRSVLDFANVIDILEKHHVDFVSTMEKFDTGTPIGKAMLMIVMIFAQLERETIQQRVIDAYASRSKRGFYMGGRVTYGFRLADTVIDGIKTKMYEPVEKEVHVINLIYSMYSEPQTSFGDIARYLNEHSIYTRKNTPFSRSRLRELVINPVYVKADYQIYEFFKSNGTDIVNSPEEFIGTNGAYLYSGDNAKRKNIELNGQHLVLAPHKGLTDSDTWLKCRRKCLNNKGTAKPVKAKSTWLAGKIKCAQCGYALAAKSYRCKTKSDNRYYLCTHRYSAGACDFGSVDADEVDKIIFAEIQKKSEEFKALSNKKKSFDNSEFLKLKSQIYELDGEISSLIRKAASANDIVMNYINSRVCELDCQKLKLTDKCIQLQKKQAEDNIGEIKDYMRYWSRLTISDKITVVDILIERISVSSNKIEIKWKL